MSVDATDHEGCEHEGCAAAHDADDPAAPAEAAPAEAAAAAAAAPEAGPSARELALTDQLQRLAADYANYQKRIGRDRAKWTQDAVRSLLSSLVPVLDNLDQVLAAFDGPPADPQVYRQGVALVRDELLAKLRGHEVERIEPKRGERFDPDRHEAVMVQEVDDAAEESVSFVARSGYRIGEQVIRAAQVGVQKPRAR